MKRCYYLLFFLGYCWVGLMQSQAQTVEKFTINGYVKEKDSGELLPNVSVYIEGKKIGTHTNSYGFFSITLDKSANETLIFSFVGYQKTIQVIKVTANHSIEIELKPQIFELDEVEVRSDDPAQSLISEDVQMSKISLRLAQAKEVPILLGEKDLLKVLQLMPGIQKGAEGTAGLYVRGGGPDQNLLILDDAPVYNAYHLFGFFSVFNGDAIKSVTLTKGGFPARFGGRLSSVIEMQMKDGNKQKMHAEGGIGLVSARLVLEGPITKDKKSSFLLSGRRTYIDVLARPFIPKSKGDGGYYFYDMNAKMNYEFDKKNKVYLSGYTGNDSFFAMDNSKSSTNFTRNNNVGVTWGNITGTFRWNHLFSERIFINTSLIYSNYQFQTYVNEAIQSQTLNSVYNLDYRSSIQDIGLKSDVDFLPNPFHTIKLGMQLVAHRFAPSALVVSDISALQLYRETPIIKALESALYVEDTYKPMSNLRVNIGIRFGQFSTDSVNYIRPEPRFATALTLPNHIALKASFATMNQYVHLLSNSGTGLPTDLWVPTTKRIAPQQSNQIALGIAKDFPDHNVALTVESYYKKMDKIISLKQGSSFLLIENGIRNIGRERATEATFEDNVTAGQGWAYGNEILVQRKTGRFSGWVGYTLSWNQQQFDELNYGKPFWAKYDRRHDVSIVGIYHLNKKITLSATWVYATGNAITLPNAVFYSSYSAAGQNSPNIPVNAYNKYEYSTRQVADYGERNTFRAASYHRLDVGIQLYKKLKYYERTLEFGIYNVYNRKNPYFYDFRTRYDESSQQTVQYLAQLSLFSIIPSFSYSFKF